MTRNLNITRRTAVGAAALALLTPAVYAQGNYPSKPVRLVVPFAPGGPTDIAARLVGRKLEAALGQPVVIDNRAGAGGTIGAAFVARAPADGYTLLYGSTSTLAVSPALFRNRLPFDAATAFQPIILVAMGPQMLVVHPSLPVNSMKEFVAYAKQNVGKLNYSSPGIGSVGHLTIELVKSATGIEATHVPFRGGAPSIRAVVAGETQFTVDAVGPMLEFVKAGRLKAISLLGEERSPLVPDLPTAVESGYKTLVAPFWNGLVAPVRTPREIVQRLATEVAKALQDPEVVKQLAVLGMQPKGLSPDQFTQFVKDESRKWAAVVKASGAKVE